VSCQWDWAHFTNIKIQNLETTTGVISCGYGNIHMLSLWTLLVYALHVRKKSTLATKKSTAGKR